ncbi:hypothetical protein LH464_24145 [Neorhizobium sp. T786]|uniref:hypothetical protein n=1 Tax=Pseudorhizobium xiangyangii TaxID=2883104 RepID=UPI001CFFDD13|nr:hypothetical protein [Neorhizobium xiangyangii]MCB5205531.1 hypothetical protein [Neorhizobium xiangyangii]
MALPKVAQVETGKSITFNAGRMIGVKRVTTTSFFHLESLIYNVYDHPVEQQTGRAIATVQRSDYPDTQHNEGALVFGGSQLWSDPKEYTAVSSGEIVQWTVSVPNRQPTVNDNAGPFKFVTVHIPKSDMSKFFLKQVGAVNS